MSNYFYKKPLDHLASKLKAAGLASSLRCTHEASCTCPRVQFILSGVAYGHKEQTLEDLPECYL